MFAIEIYFHDDFLKLTPIFVSNFTPSARRLVNCSGSHDFIVDF